REDDDPRAPVGQLADHRQAGPDPAVVGDLPGAGQVQGDVQVRPQEHAAAEDLQVVDGSHYRSREATSTLRSTSRLEYPHSLSEHPKTFTLLPYAIVIDESNVQDAGEPTMSDETIGSSV